MRHAGVLDIHWRLRPHVPKNLVRRLERTATLHASRGQVQRIADTGTQAPYLNCKEFGATLSEKSLVVDRRLPR